jgi:hypothetical protein
MFCLSIALDYMLIQAVHLTCLFTMLLLNLSFGLFLDLRQRKLDTSFRHWTDDHKPHYKSLKWLLMTFSFKSVRLMYSRLHPSKPYLNVPFENLYSSLIRPLFIATIINFLLQAGPIFLMNAYMLMFIPWGYQLMVMSIDNMILAFVIFVLEIFEFAYFKRRAVEGKQLMAPPKKERDQSVYGGYYEEGEGEGEGGPDSSSSMMYLNENRERLERAGAISREELKVIENMYMSKHGYKK